MGTIEMLLTEAHDHAVRSGAIAEAASQTGSPEKQYELMRGAETAAQAALKAIVDARRALVGGMSRD